MSDHTTLQTHGITIIVAPSDGDDSAVVVLIDTPFEPDGNDGPGLRVFLNDSPIYTGVSYQTGLTTD
jgi:hypothetical protein